MKSSTQTCDQLRLEQFLTGELSGEAELALTAHLDECSVCRTQMERLAADRTSWDEAEVLLKTQEHDQEESSAGPTGQSLQVQQVLDSLAPTDDPEMLGRLGDHEVSGVVGVGAMGVVLKAQDRSLDRIVAIKVLAPHLATSGSARKRFAREAKAAAAVLHPNVMAIHSVSNDESLPFLVMPYMRGASLQRRLDDDGPLPASEILRIGSQIAAGLAAAHSQGLVHRDIKPANILLEEGVERVAITDFGLARAVDDATMTRTGFIAGTPQYMSPEQARGDSVDQRSDLFSLGSVMYTMCAGRPPFRAETSYGVMRRITDTEARPIREVNPEVPEWLCQIIDKLMSKRPEGRFDSASEVAELLEECLAHIQQPTVVPLPPQLVTQSSGRRLSSFFSHSPGVIAMYAFVGLAVLGIVFQQGAETPDAQPSSPPDKTSQVESGENTTTPVRPDTPSSLDQRTSKKRTVDRSNARSVVEAYIAAALAEETAVAAALATSSPATPRQIEAFSENLNVRRLAIKWVYVSDKTRPSAALAVSEKVKLSDPQPDGQAEGLLVFTLVRADDEWSVRDIDFETEDGAQDELKRFLTDHPGSIVMLPETNEPLATTHHIPPTPARVDSSSAPTKKLSKPRTVDRGNARSVAEGYVAAALAAETAAAASLAKNSPADRKRIEEFSDHLNLKRLAIEWVYVSDKTRPAEALAVSDTVTLTDPQPDGLAEGLMLFTLKRTDGAWYVVDIDFESTDSADEELKRFAIEHPGSIVLPPVANNSFPASASSPAPPQLPVEPTPAASAVLTNHVPITFHLAYFEPAEKLTEYAVVDSNRKVFAVKESFASCLDIAAAHVIDDVNNQPAIEITFSPASAERLDALTSQHLNKPVAIIANGKLLSTPIIRDRFGSKALITGQFSREEADRIAAGIIRYKSLLDELTKQYVPDVHAEPVWGEPVNGLQLALGGISKNRHFKPGETIHFHLRVRNVGSETIQFQYHIPKMCNWLAPLVETAAGQRVRLNQMRFRGGHKLYAETLEPESVVSIHVRGVLVLGDPQTAHKWWPRIEKPEPGEFTLKAFAPPIYLLDSNGKRFDKHLTLSSGTVNVHFDKATASVSDDVNAPE